jgi:hypothetical protein
VHPRRVAAFLGQRTARASVLSGVGAPDRHLGAGREQRARHAVADAAVAAGHHDAAAARSKGAYMAQRLVRREHLLQPAAARPCAVVVRDPGEAVHVHPVASSQPVSVKRYMSLVLNARPAPTDPSVLLLDQREASAMVCGTFFFIASIAAVVGPTQR